MDHLTSPGLAYSQILLARIYEPLVLVNTVLICFVMRYKRVNPNVFGAYIQWGFLIGILREMSTIKTEHSFTITINVRFGLCPRESISPLDWECFFPLVFVIFEVFQGLMLFSSTAGVFFLFSTGFSICPPKNFNKDCWLMAIYQLLSIYN